MSGRQKGGGRGTPSSKKSTPSSKKGQKIVTNYFQPAENQGKKEQKGTPNTPTRNRGSPRKTRAAKRTERSPKTASPASSQASKKNWDTEVSPMDKDQSSKPLASLNKPNDNGTEPKISSPKISSPIPKVKDPPTTTRSHEKLIPPPDRPQDVPTPARLSLENPSMVSPEDAKPETANPEEKEGPKESNSPPTQANKPLKPAITFATKVQISPPAKTIPG